MDPSESKPSLTSRSTQVASVRPQPRHESGAPPQSASPAHGLRKCAQPAPAHDARANGSTGRAPAPAPPPEEEAAGHWSSTTRSARSSLSAGEATNWKEHGAGAVSFAQPAYEHVS